MWYAGWIVAGNCAEAGRSGRMKKKEMERESREIGRAFIPVQKSVSLLYSILARTGVEIIVSTTTLTE